MDAVPHIPEHRKLPLFTHLLKTVGSQDYLHVALGLLVEKQVVQDTARDGVNQVSREWRGRGTGGGVEGQGEG